MTTKLEGHVSEQLVSVIIPTKNSARTIKMCLESVRKQTYTNLEIIVVDNNSVDSTVQIAETYGAKVLNIAAERTKAKNLGAACARGSFLFFVDSDFELTSKVVEDCVEASKKGFDAIIFGEKIVGDGFWTKCRSLERHTYIGDDLVESPSFFYKQAFLNSGGYNESMVFGEEADLHRRIRALKFRVGRIPTLVLHHEGPFPGVVRRKYYYGKSSLTYIKRHGSYAITQFGPTRFLRARTVKVLIKNPFWILGILMSKSIEYIAVTLGLISGFLESSQHALSLSHECKEVIVHG